MYNTALEIVQNNLVVVYSLLLGGHQSRLLVQPTLAVTGLPNWQTSIGCLAYRTSLPLLGRVSRLTTQPGLLSPCP